MASPARTLDRSHYSDTKRIVNSHSGHFIALSLFFLPLSFSLINFATTSLQFILLESEFVSARSLLFHNFDLCFLKSVLLVVFILFLSILGVATITYSTHHAFCGRPVSLIAAIKSLSHSFIPLLSTTIAILISLILTCYIFLLSGCILLKGVKILGFQINYIPIYPVWFSVIALIALWLILIFLLANWSLASAIVVIESKWGLEPLQRSTDLLRGMRSESFFMLFLYATSIGVMAIANSITAVNWGVIGFSNWALVLQAVVASGYPALMMLHHVAASTVLYMHCEALHGGASGFGTMEKFTGAYVSVPVDEENPVDDKDLSSEVSKVESNGVFEYLCVFLTLFWSLFNVGYLFLLSF